MRLQLIFGIHRATHRIGLFIQKRAPGFTQAEAHILCHLHEAGNSSIADLHLAFAHKRSTLTSVLDRLESRGLVKREVSRTDRRSFVVSLTPAGKKKAARIHALLASLEADVLEPTDRRALPSVNQMLRAIEQKATED
jgi:DNA-binding MarR family transcriptional regulator